MNKPDRRKHRIWLNKVAILGSIILVSVYMITIGVNPPSPVKNPGIKSDKVIADKIATQFQLTRFTEDGNIDHTLTTARAAFYRDTSYRDTSFVDTNTESEDSFTLPTQGHSQTGQRDYALLAHPKMTIYSDSHHQTNISAQQGIYYPNQQIVELEDEVVASEQETESKIKTASLTVDTEQKQVLTKDHVTLVNPTSRTTATGLQGNLTQQHWQLLANVKSTINTSPISNKPD